MKDEDAEKDLKVFLKWLLKLRMRFHGLLPFAAYLCGPGICFSQSSQLIPLSRENTLLLDSYFNRGSSGMHTAVKPFINSKEVEAASDSVARQMGFRPLQRKSANSISVNGIINAEAGYEQAGASDRKMLLEGGLSLSGRIGNKLSGNFLFLPGNSSFPSYLDTFANRQHLAPGMGSAYRSGMGYSYQYYSGYLSYSPNKIFNFQIGKDKHFWGDGYRSLFLSDVSNSFPFLKITTTVWKLQYVSLFAAMRDVSASPFKNDFKNKYGSFHYLSWNASRRFNFSLFESVIWQGTDSNRARSFDVNYLNPVVFYRPVEYSLGSSDNVLLGGAFKIKVGSKMRQQFYGQVILDEFVLKEVLAIFKKAAHPFDHTIRYGWWANKQGVQLGFRSFDLFTVKNLFFQTEVNAVRPYTYSHGSVLQNYANYGQPLAHPLGANFTESVSFLNYRYKKWMFGTELLYAIYGKDRDGKNYGGNIFESYLTHPMDYGNKFWQGLKTNLYYTQAKLGYCLVPAANLLAEAGIAFRQEKNSAGSSSSRYVFIGIRTNIMNRYSDF